MAFLANHSLLLLVGLNFLANNCCPTFATERSASSLNGKEPEIKFLHDAMPTEKNQEISIDESATLQTRALNIQTHKINKAPSDNGRTSFLDNVNGVSLSGEIPNRLSMLNNKKVDINEDNLILLGGSKSKLRINVVGNQVYIGDELVCEDTSKLDKSAATYQRSADGSLWYTNIKIGQPMTKAEIRAFEKIRAEAIVQDRFKNSENNDSGSGPALGGWPFPKGGSNWFQDMMGDLKSAKTKPSNNSGPSRIDDFAASLGGPGSSAWKFRNSNQVVNGNGQHGFNDDGPMMSSPFKPPVIINHNNVFNGFGNGVVNDGEMGFSSMTHNWVGHHVDAKQDGLILRGSLPGGDLNVSLRNGQVYVNDELVADDVTELGEKLSYSKSNDGAFWHGNVTVGEPVTDKAEIEAFEKEWNEFQAEKERRFRERQMARQKRMQERKERERLRRQRSASRQRSFRGYN